MANKRYKGHNYSSAVSGVDSAIDATGKNLFWKFVAQLNKWLNPSHAWTDYQSKNDSYVDSWMNRQSGLHLTGAEQASNAFNADEAQKQRDWEEYMSSTAYQRQVSDMQSSGVNPALMYGGSGASGASTPSGTSASSVTPGSGGFSMSDLMQFFLIKPTIEQMRANSSMMRDQGKAAIMNAKSNERQAGAAERNAGSNESQARSAEFRAETDRMRQEIESWRTRYDIQLSQATVDKLAAETVQINEFTRQLPERLELMKKDADSHQKQAYAALQSAVAANRQAAVSENLSDSEIALREAQAFVHWANGEGQFIVNQYLDEHQMAEIKELDSRSGYLDSASKNLDRNAKVQWMQTVTGYTNAACNIANTVFNGFSTFTGTGSRNPIGFN